MPDENKNGLDMETLAKRLDTDPELKDDIVIKPLWEKLIIKTNVVISKEKLLIALRQDIAEARGGAKSLLELIEERVQQLDKPKGKPKPKKKG